MVWGNGSVVDLWLVEFRGRPGWVRLLHSSIVIGFDKEDRRYLFRWKRWAWRNDS